MIDKWISEQSLESVTPKYKIITKKRQGKVIMASEKKYSKTIYNWSEDERAREHF